MKRISFIDAQKSLEASKHVDLPELRVSILRNIMVEPFDVYLKYFVQRIGSRAVIEYGEYDQVVQEVMQGDERLFEKPDVVIIFLQLETLSWNLSRSFSSLSVVDIEQEIIRVEGYIQNIMAGIRRRTSAMILWHAFETPVAPAYGMIDSCEEWGQSSVIGALNSMLKGVIGAENSAYMIDMNSCLARIGYKQFYDNRYWHLSKAPYSRQATQEIAFENFKFLRALKGKSKKCLVLDCDNTLWGGILGEDGLENVKLGKSHPGSVYYEFQQEILNLYHRGIILTLCSKNNERDVWEIFEKHPDMLLKKEHISAAMINWDDKSTNIRRLADGLNIGLESMVFIDDSQFECDLIRQSLPVVEVLCFSDSVKLDLRHSLISDGIFDSLTVSDEDRNRGELYRAEAVREKSKNSFLNLEVFYESLRMDVTVKLADDFAIPRIAQLTQKTNQFNLTTLRYTEAEIRKLSGSDEADIFYVQLEDKFGDYGIIGVSVVRYNKKEAVIEAFLLSCRALGRGVEDILLERTMAVAKAKGRVQIIGKYSPTAKNMQVKEFYDRHQYQSMSEAKNQNQKLYLSLLTNEILVPEHFNKIIFA